MLSEILSSNLLSALIGAVVGILTVFTTMRKDDISVIVDNITKERKDWRTYLREWIGEVSKKALTKEWTIDSYLFYRSQLVSRLNPFDIFDKGLLGVFDKLKPNKSNEYGLDVNLNDLLELQEKITHLLKHDWERVKLDCTPWYTKVLHPRLYIQSKCKLKENFYRKSLDESK